MIESLDAKNLNNLVACTFSLYKFSYLLPVIGLQEHKDLKYKTLDLQLHSSANFPLIETLKAL